MENVPMKKLSTAGSKINFVYEYGHPSRILEQKNLHDARWIKHIHTNLRVTCQNSNISKFSMETLTENNAVPLKK